MKENYTIENLYNRCCNMTFGLLFILLLSPIVILIGHNFLSKDFILLFFIPVIFILTQVLTLLGSVKDSLGKEIKEKNNI